MIELFVEFLESVKSCEFYISPLDHVRKLRYSSIVHLTSINNFQICQHLVITQGDSAQGRRSSYLEAQALYLSLRTS